MIVHATPFANNCRGGFYIRPFFSYDLPFPKDVYSGAYRMRPYNGASYDTQKNCQDFPILHILFTIMVYNRKRYGFFPVPTATDAPSAHNFGIGEG